MGQNGLAGGNLARPHVPPFLLACSGIAFFMYHRKEQRLQDRDKDEEMTFIDCAFFATVLR